MAPSRRKGSSKAAAAAADRRQWKVGDLVLAKVKGFPAWPAMVSEPDKWDQSADWRKVFVYFFGTGQIGFCNPVDVEEFTEEKKESLLIRRHGKGADFVRALNEIIDCFDKLKKESQEISANCTNVSNAMKEDDSAESVIKSGSKDETATVTLKSYLKTPISSEATHDLNFLTEAAAAAAAADGMHDEDMQLDDPDANCTATDKPSSATCSTRSKAEVSRPEKGVSERRTSARKSRGSSRIDPQDVTLPSSNDTRSSRRGVSNKLWDTSLRRSKRIMKLPDCTNGHEKYSPAFVSNDSDDENDSDTVTESDNLSCDECSTLDSGCKPEQPEPLNENCEGLIELSDRLDFQTNTIIIKKKRKPNRKRHNNDTADLAAKLDKVITEVEVHKAEQAFTVNDGKSAEKCIKEDGDGKSAEKCIKEDGDEHLPLVKRARVRMGRPSPSGEEPDSLVCMEDQSLDASKSLTMQSSGLLNSKEVGSAATQHVYVEGDSDNLSAFDGSLSRKPQGWGSGKNLVDGEAALPPSKRLHRALEAMSANAAEDGQTVSECGLLMVNASANGYCSSSPRDCPDLSMASGAEIQPVSVMVEVDANHQPVVLTVEGADAKHLNDSVHVQSAETNFVEPNLKPHSPSSGEKHDHVDCTGSSTDHPETECSELGKSLKGSHDDITQSSVPLLGKEIAVGSPQHDTAMHLDKGCGEVGKTSPSSGEKHAHVDCTSSSVDHHESECSELAKSLNWSLDEITRSSDPLLGKEITIGSALNDTTMHPDEGCGDVDKTSPSSGEKGALVDCTSSSADHHETECSEFAKSLKWSRDDITWSSDPPLGKEIATVSPRNDTAIHLDKGCGEVDKSSDSQNLLLAETDREKKTPEFVKEDESASKGPLAIPVKAMNNSCNKQLSRSSSSLDDHPDNKTVPFTQTSSPPTDLDSFGRTSPPSSSTENMSSLEKNNCLESNSCSPDVSLLLDKAKLAGKSSSKGEANNALSSFETILGSLSRTKESIGRATRIAIDCAKFGFASKVMEILAQSLEHESSYSRRVDLFFLIDSITQCSRGMKGDGGIYPSAIQPLLPRLLLAAAPPGSSHENHRQCLKVLRVWHERKILPEPIIRHHIQDLDAICSSYLNGASSRRLLRNERAFDDPIRQMEDMPVDEYGSNSSFQMPGFCMPPMLQDEDGGSDSDGENFEAVTPEHDAENVDEQSNLPPAVEKRRHILEDVDGELEMEDVAPACETEMTSISNTAGLGSEQMSIHQSESHFGAPFAPPSRKDIPPSPSLSRSPLPPALPPALPDSLSHGSDWKVRPSLQKTESNHEPLAKHPIMPNTNLPTSDALHHHARHNRSFEAQMPRVSDFNNSCPFDSQPGSHQSARASHTISPADGAFNKGFHLRPPHPSPTNQFSYVQDQRVPQRDVSRPSYNNRFHSQNAGNGNFYRDHDRMKYPPRDNIGECWRPPMPSVSGPCYPEGGRPRPPISYAGPPCEPPLPNNGWVGPPQPMNQRQYIPYRQHSEGPIPVASRGPNFWRPRRAI